MFDTGSGPVAAEKNEQLEVTLPTTSTGGTFGAGFRSKFLLSGDFEIWVEYSHVNWPQLNGTRLGLIASPQIDFWNTNGIGAMERISGWQGAERYLTDFTFAQPPFPTVVTDHQQGTMRLVRTGSTITGAFWDPLVSQWIVVGGANNVLTDDINITLGTWSHTAPSEDIIVAYDNFIVVSGTVVNPPDPPDIVMHTARTVDSRGVQVVYEIVGTDIAPFLVRVLRSPDATCGDANDVNIKSILLSGDQGLHVEDITVRLDIDPRRPYVLVCADLDNMVIEADELNNVAFFRKYVVAIVTHGFIPSLPFPFDDPPDWIDIMATSFEENIGYDRGIPFGWRGSNLPVGGQATQAGANLAKFVAKELADFLRQVSAGPNDTIDVHWIGHSRGCGVSHYLTGFVSL